MAQLHTVDIHTLEERLATQSSDELLPPWMMRSLIWLIVVAFFLVVILFMLIGLVMKHIPLLVGALVVGGIGFIATLRFGIRSRVETDRPDKNAILKHILNVEKLPSKLNLGSFAAIVALLFGIAALSYVAIYTDVLEKLDDLSKDLAPNATRWIQIFVVTLGVLFIFAVLYWVGMCLYRIGRGILQPDDYEYSMAYDFLRYFIQSIANLPSLLLLTILATTEVWIREKVGSGDMNEGFSFIPRFVILMSTILGPMYLGRLLPGIWAARPMHDGDYERTLRRLDFLGRYWLNFTEAHQRYYRAEAYFYQGNFAEAENLWRTHILQADRSVDLVPKDTIENLGWVLLYQEKYEDAANVFLGLLEIDPRWNGAYAGLAELYLIQHQKPTEAEWLAEKSTTLKDHSVKDWQRARYWAIYAQALTRNRRQSEADDAANTALRLTASQKSNLHKALPLFQLGMLWQEQGEMGKAADSFQQVTALDPHGYFGQRAGEMLHSL